MVFSCIGSILTYNYPSGSGPRPPGAMLIQYDDRLSLLAGASQNTIDLLPKGQPWTEHLKAVEGHEAAYKFDGKTGVKVWQIYCCSHSQCLWGVLAVGSARIIQSTTSCVFVGSEHTVQSHTRQTIHTSVLDGAWPGEERWPQRACPM